MKAAARLERVDLVGTIPRPRGGQNHPEVTTSAGTRGGLALRAAQDRFAVLERVMVHENGEGGGIVGLGGRLRADDVAAADEATGGRQGDDDDDRVEY
jgi:hypothetical protein